MGILHREAETTPRNNEQTVTRYTSVDNHGPVLANFAPALGEYRNETVEEVDSAVEWTQTDALFGMESGVIQHNTAARFRGTRRPCQTACSAFARLPRSRRERDGGPLADHRQRQAVLRPSGAWVVG